MKFLSREIYSLFFLLLLFSAPVCADVGFLAPGGIPEATVHKVGLILFNGENVQQVAKNLDKVDGTAVKVLVDLSSMLTRPMDIAKVKSTYSLDGSIRTKAFAPQNDSKLRKFLPDQKIKEALDPIFDVFAEHADNVYAVLPADEPYLNGISKAQMEHVSGIVRKLLDAHGLAEVKIGVVFASGMFDRRFAHLLNRRAGMYVKSIDDYFAKGQVAQGKAADFAAWVDSINRNRLTTYDQAGNMYVDGGLPRGYDVFGYDFYLATILLDGLHEDSLSWFATHYPDKGCARFAGEPMTKIRSRLSFFKAAADLETSRDQLGDRALLDAIFQCRMGAMTKMLVSAVRGRQAELLLIAEASDNGVLDFDPAGTPKRVQPKQLIHRRVLDEVNRGEKFYDENRCVYTAGLLFFTYDDAYDERIKLDIGGVVNDPEALDSIYRFARKENLASRAGDMAHRSCFRRFGQQ